MGVKVWKVHLDRREDRHRRSLSYAERERALRLADPLERRRFVVAHAALRAVLAEQCGIPDVRLAFRTEESGRPYLESWDGDFNLSHSGEWALIAVAPPGSRVGVDVERISSDVDFLEMAARMYQPEEAARVREAGRAEYFRLWTAKEAYVKAAGVGLAGLRDVVVRQGSATATVLSRSLPGEWPVRWLDVAPGYAAALVTTASTPAPRIC